MVDDPLGLDITQALRGVVDLAGLVRYVVATNTKNETDWLEWKGPLDLSTADHRFSVSKQILGFSNRDPDRAAAHAGGCAYVVIGAEPGHLAGQSPMDPADLEAGLRRYIGVDGPAWTPVWVTVDGIEVLVILVEPPRWGDPIRTLRRDFERFGDGAVFVRRLGGTHQASSDEMVMLQARRAHRLGVAPMELAVDVLGDPLPVIDPDDAYFAQWIAHERQRLLAPLTASRQPIEEPSTAVRLPVGDLFWMEPEDRTQDQYAAEVDQYLEEVAETLPYLAMWEFVDREIALLHLQLHNPTERNVPGVQLEVHLEGNVRSFDEDLPRIELPEPPRLWGPRRRSRLEGLSASLPNLSQIYSPTSIRPPVFRRYSSENPGSTIIRFDSEDLRPFGRVSLEEVPLLVGVAVGPRITGHWRATSTGYDGLIEGDLSIATGGPVSVEELLAEAHQ